ncbi:hypothetical protein VULLAG_LOCUS6640 [Vulpes lagopus]
MPYCLKKYKCNRSPHPSFPAHVHTRRIGIPGAEAQARVQGRLHLPLGPGPEADGRCHRVRDPDGHGQRRAHGRKGSEGCGAPTRARGRSAGTTVSPKDAP